VAICSGERSEIAATETAAGLNKCLFSTVNKYFAAIASIEAPIINSAFVGNFTGIIKPKIKAVIKTDSELVTALKIFAKTKFAI
jgi:hypothetical protein